MGDLTLTKHAGQLAAQLYSLRRSVTASGDTGLQRIGILTSNAGQAHTVYYNPDTDTIIYDNGVVPVSQQ